MKIIGLVCSPRQGGNTQILMEEALAAAREAGAQTELIFVPDLDIAPCDACGSCEESGRCKNNDDMDIITQSLEDADGMIFGTPVYFINVTAQAKTVIDRTYAYIRTGKLKGKVAAALIAARQIGAGQVLSLLYTFFAVHRMIIAGGGIGYGREIGEVRTGPGGAPGFTALQEARSVGRNVAAMIKKFKGESA